MVDTSSSLSPVSSSTLLHNNSASTNNSSVSSQCCDTSDSHSHSKKKRVGKACDYCRLKKTKCNGKQPCERCIADNKICIYTERKKSKDKVYSSEYVELIDRRLSLVTKSLLKLCDLVKFNKVDELSEFANNLDFNEQHEVSPISINQVISLLVNEHELEVDRKEFSASTATTKSLNKAAIQSNLNALSNKKSNKKKIIPPILPSESTISRSILSSPESLSPKSTGISPTYNFDNIPPIPLTKIKEEEYDEEPLPMLTNLSSLNDDVSNFETASNMISPVDELDDVAMMGFNSLDLAKFHSNGMGLLNNSGSSNNTATGTTFRNNTNALTENTGTDLNLHNNSFTSLNTSASNLIQKNAIQISPPTQLNENTLDGYFSPASITSDSSVLMFDNALDSNPLFLNSDSVYLDKLSMSPPTSLVKRSSSATSTIGSGSIKKIGHHNRSHSHSHGHGLGHSYNMTTNNSNTNNLLYPQQQNTQRTCVKGLSVKPALTTLDPAVASTMPSDLSMHFTNEEFV